MQGLGGLPLHLGDVDAFLGHLVKWRELAQFGDDLDHLVDHVVDFLLRVEAAEAEADRGVRQGFADAQRLEDVAGLQGGRSASGAARYRNVVDAHQKRLTFDVGEAHVQVVGQAMFQRAVDENLVELCFQAFFQTVTQSAQPQTLCLHLLLAELTSFAEADDASDVERARTHAALVPPAIDDGRELHARIAPANVERANTLGAIDFVAANGQQVDVVFLHVDRNLAHGLHAIDREENAVFLGNFADFGDRVDHANFIVGVHDGDQDGSRADGGFQFIQVDSTVLLDRQIGNFKAFFFQALAGVQDRFVLDGLGNDVIALFAEHLRDALDHQVVGFGRAAGKDDFFGRGTDQRSNLLTRGFDRFFASPAEAVIAACGIAKFLSEIRQHRFHNARVNRRGGVIIHINRQLDSHFLSLLTRTHVRTRTHWARQGDKGGLIWVLAHLRNRHGAQNSQNTFIHFAERLANRAPLRSLAVSMAGHARCNED